MTLNNHQETLSVHAMTGKFPFSLEDMPKQEMHISATGNVFGWHLVLMLPIWVSHFAVYFANIIICVWSIHPSPRATAVVVWWHKAFSCTKPIISFCVSLKEVSVILGAIQPNYKGDSQKIIIALTLNTRSRWSDNFTYISFQKATMAQK